MKKPAAHSCTICSQPYNKKDFAVCPHCGGDGGGVTPKGWRPTKNQKKDFIKKQQTLN